MKVPKPIRRKRKGKLIGNYIIKLDGGRRWLNLQTQDPSLARRRAELAAQDLWPEPAAAAAAATVAAAAEPEPRYGDTPAIQRRDFFGNEDDDQDDVGDESDDQAEKDGVSKPEPGGAGAGAPPASAGAGEGDPTTAAQAAAASVTVDADQIAAELGIDTSELELLIPETCAEGLLIGQSWLVRFGARWMANKKVEPRAVPDKHMCRRLLVIGIRLQMAEWGTKLDRIRPWMLILGGLGVGAWAQLKGVRWEDLTEPPAASEG